MVKTLTIIADDKVGLLMDISYIMGKEKINIENISAFSIGGKAIFTLAVKDPNKARSVLRKNGFSVMEEDMIMIKIPDKPGELSKISKLMADNKINMTNLQVISRDNRETVIALSTTKNKKAKEVLKDMLVETYNS